MTREEAIKWFEGEKEAAQRQVVAFESCFKCFKSAHRKIVAYNDMAISALREQEQKRYNNHDVACIIAELFGDDCACNFNGIDEWLPMKCELLDACPNTVGVACWEQYLKHKEDT